MQIFTDRSAGENRAESVAVKDSAGMMDSIILDFILSNLKTKGTTLKAFLNAFEERIIVQTLRISNGNQRVAAGLLGTRHTTLNEKVKKYKIPIEDFKIDLLKNIEGHFREILGEEKNN